MAETSITYTLATPSGTLTFSTGPGDYYALTSAPAGMDSSDLRGGGTSLATRDGGVAGPRYRNPMFVTFEGVIVASTTTVRRTMEDNLRAYLLSAARANATLSWTPTGTTARQRLVRLSGGPIITGGYLKSFQFVIESPDPLAYSTSLTTSANITVNGAAVNMTNNGNVSTWPTLQLHGLVTNPIIKNNTTGKTLEFDFGAGVVVADATYLTIDTLNETVLLSTDSTSRLAALDRVASEFWQLAPGVNAIEVDGTTPGANAKGVVLFRDAYA